MVRAVPRKSLVNFHDTVFHFSVGGTIGSIEENLEFPVFRARKQVYCYLRMHYILQSTKIVLFPERHAGSPFNDLRKRLGVLPGTGVLAQAFQFPHLLGDRQSKTVRDQAPEFVHFPVNLSLAKTPFPSLVVQFREVALGSTFQFRELALGFPYLIFQFPVPRVVFPVRGRVSVRENLRKAGQAGPHGPALPEATSGQDLCVIGSPRLPLGLPVALAAPSGVPAHLAPDRGPVAPRPAGDRRAGEPAFPVAWIRQRSP